MLGKAIRISTNATTTRLLGVVRCWIRYWPVFKCHQKSVSDISVANRPSRQIPVNRMAATLSGAAEPGADLRDAHRANSPY